MKLAAKRMTAIATTAAVGAIAIAGGTNNREDTLIICRRGDTFKIKIRLMDWSFYKNIHVSVFNSFCNLCMRAAYAIQP